MIPSRLLQWRKTPAPTFFVALPRRSMAPLCSALERRQSTFWMLAEGVRLVRMSITPLIHSCLGAITGRRPKTPDMRLQQILRCTSRSNPPFRSLSNDLGAEPSASDRALRDDSSIPTKAPPDYMMLVLSTAELLGACGPPWESVRPSPPIFNAC